MAHPDIERVLLGPEEIGRRVGELAGEISRACAPGPVTAVGVLTGAFVFLSDLLRCMEVPVVVAFVRAESYRDGTRPGELRVEVLGDPDLAGKDVLVVEDILDTGRSLTGIVREISARKPRSLRTAVLLDKEERREALFVADFTGFPVPDEFLVGYGLDYAGRYRDLPYVGVLRRSVYEDRR